MDENQKIDFFSPEIIMAGLFAIIADASIVFGIVVFIIAVGISIPTVAIGGLIGIPMAGLILFLHYMAALMTVAIFWRHIRGWMASLTLILAAILPAPLLTLGIFLAIILSNKVIAFFAEQALVLAATAITVEAGGVGGVGAEAATAAKTAASATAKGVEVAAKGAVATEKAAKTAKEVEESVRRAKRTVRGIRRVGESLDNVGHGENEESPDLEQEMETNAQKPWTGEELFEQIPQNSKEEEPQDAQGEKSAKTMKSPKIISTEEDKEEKAEEVRKKQEKLPTLRDITEPDKSNNGPTP